MLPGRPVDGGVAVNRSSASRWAHPTRLASHLGRETVMILGRPGVMEPGTAHIPSSLHTPRYEVPPGSARPAASSPGRSDTARRAARWPRRCSVRPGTTDPRTCRVESLDPGAVLQTPVARQRPAQHPGDRHAPPPPRLPIPLPRRRLVSRPRQFHRSTPATVLLVRRAPARSIHSNREAHAWYHRRSRS